MAQETVEDTADMKKEFPNVFAWMERMKARPATKEILSQIEAMKKQIGYAPVPLKKT